MSFDGWLGTAHTALMKRDVTILHGMPQQAFIPISIIKRWNNDFKNLRIPFIPPLSFSNNNIPEDIWCDLVCVCKTFILKNPLKKHIDGGNSQSNMIICSKITYLEVGKDLKNLMAGNFMETKQIMKEGLFSATPSLRKSVI